MYDKFGKIWKFWVIL